MGDFDLSKDHASLQRRAENTKLYADACKALGVELQVPVVDLSTLFLQHAGWKEGSLLLGSLSTPRNERFDNLFIDGKVTWSEGLIFLRIDSW
jgi:hypothetical protein